MNRRSSEQDWSSCLGSIPTAVAISSALSVAVPDVMMGIDKHCVGINMKNTVVTECDVTWYNEFVIIVRRCHQYI